MSSPRRAGRRSRSKILASRHALEYRSLGLETRARRERLRCGARTRVRRFRSRSNGRGGSVLARVRQRRPPEGGRYKFTSNGKRKRAGGMPGYEQLWSRSGCQGSQMACTNWRARWNKICRTPWRCLRARRRRSMCFCVICRKRGLCATKGRARGARLISWGI
jgi:hypothetical protein